MHYHYTACGLDNVWLANGYVEKSTAYGKAVAINNVEGLHKLLGRDLLKKKGRLTGKELRFLRVQMGMSQQGLAHMQGVTEQAVSLWERTGRVPHANDALTRLLYRGHVAGDTPLRKAIERLNDVERMVHQRIVASSSPRGWTSTITDEADDEAACAA